MNKKGVLILIILLLLVGAVVYFAAGNPVQAPESVVTNTEAVFDGKSATFTVEGESVTLSNGISEKPTAPGSASKITTRYFGNEAKGDLNGDGLQDIAFLITQDGGGSGLFYYAVVALKTAEGYKTTNAFLVGDRIAPQTTEIHADSQELYVNFAKRKDGEPMTARPSVGVTLFLKVTPAGVLEGLMH